MFIQKQKQQQKKESLEQLREENFDDELTSAFEGNYQDVYEKIDAGLGQNDLLLFQSKITNLVKVFLSMEQKIIETMDYDYETIKEKTFKIYEKEKKTIIEKIGKLNKYEQNVEKLQRKLKLGVYYVNPNAYKNTYAFEHNNIDPPPVESFVGNESLDPNNNMDISYGDNSRDFELSEEAEDGDIGNPLVDEDDIYEDPYGETRLDDEDV